MCERCSMSFLMLFRAYAVFMAVHAVSGFRLRRHLRSFHVDECIADTYCRSFASPRAASV